MAHRRAKALGSVGNAAGLFGGGDDDFFSSFPVAPAPAAPQAPPIDTTAFNPPIQGIGTVYEEEEPLSPEIPSGFAPLSSTLQSSAPQQWPEPIGTSDAHVEYPANQYSYEQAPNEYDHQAGLPNQNNSNSDYSYPSQYDTTGASDSYQPPVQSEEIPYYPGYIYDFDSNSYLPDPNALPVEEWGQQSTAYEGEVANGSGYDQQGVQTSYQGDMMHGDNSGAYVQGGYEAGQQQNWNPSETSQQHQYEQYSAYPAESYPLQTEDYAYSAYPSSQVDETYSQNAYQSYDATAPQDFYSNEQQNYSADQYTQIPQESSHSLSLETAASVPIPETPFAPAPQDEYPFSPPRDSEDLAQISQSPPARSKSIPPPPRAASSATTAPARRTVSAAPPRVRDAVSPPSHYSSLPDATEDLASLPSTPPTSFPCTAYDAPQFASPSSSPPVVSNEESSQGVSPTNLRERSNILRQASPFDFETTESPGPRHDDEAAQRAIISEAEPEAPPRPSWEDHRQASSSPLSFRSPVFTKQPILSPPPANGLGSPMIESHQGWGEGAASMVVPELNFEAPSPVISEQYAVEPLQEPDPLPQSFEGSQEEYGFDDSQVFAEGKAAHSQESSGYGEWSGSSEAQQGYDYVSGYGNSHAGEDEPSETTAYDTPTSNSTPHADPTASDTAYQSYGMQDSSYQQPASPYNPSDSQYEPSSSAISNDSPYSPPPARATASTPDRSNFYSGSRYSESSPYQSPQKTSISLQSSPQKQAFPAPYGSFNRGESYDSYGTTPQYNQSNQPAYSQGQDSYAPYPSTSKTYDPYSSQAPGNMTAPASYGSLSTQQDSVYAPSQYDAAVDRRYSFDTNAPNSNTNPFDPYARPSLSRSVTASNGGPVPDLGLERRRAPVVTFGFGGRMLVVFPGSGVQPAYGSDLQNGYGSDTSTPSTVHIRKLVDVLPPLPSESYPGPLFMDGGKSNAGKKRKEAVAWLETRIAELEREGFQRTGGTFGQSNESPKKLDARSILVKLVKVMVENEGKLSGTPKIDEIVRSILVPYSSASDFSDTNLPLASELHQSAALTPTLGSDMPIATYTVSSSSLDRISAFLLRGERRKAVRYALDQKLWAHAFVISSCVDTDCWKEVVSEFLASELSPSLGEGASPSNGREGLRVAYSMFAGLGADSMKQFLPPQTLDPSALSTFSRISPAIPPVTSAGFNWNDTSLTSDLPDPILDQWQETTAMIVANRTSGDSAALTALGDTLMSNGWIDAAHVCYLLSPGTSPIGGIGIPSTRIVLLGAAAPTKDNVAGIEIESIILTELAEFAFSLAPTTKGQEPFAGFPHLQAFRLYHASLMVDAGLTLQAQKYTDAIVGTLKLATKASPFYNAGLVAQVKSLTDRLATAPGQDKAGSWMSRKVQRPTIDSLWSTLEGRFTKFVAGEGEPTAQILIAKAAESTRPVNPQVGPFSHYSTISPAATSGTLSRVPSSSDLAQQPPSRPTSASHYPMPTSSGPPPVKRAPYKTHHARSSSLGFTAGYNYDPTVAPSWEDSTPKSTSHEFPSSSAYEYDSPAYGTPDDSSSAAAPNSSDWWGSEQEGADSTASTSSLRAPAFTPLSESFAEDDSGFISPMAAYTPSASPSPSVSAYPFNQQAPHKRTSTRDELDDLGLGNSKSRQSTFESIEENGGEGEDGTSGQSDVKPAEEQTMLEKPAMKPSRSWLGGWFKKEAGGAMPAGPGPIKANLGEQTSFVYDPVAKRWVNKKVGDLGSSPLATAPPPRAATASPTRAARAHMPPRFQSSTPSPTQQGHAMPPLNRAKTSADLGDLNRAGQYRSASAGPSSIPPPPSRPGSASGLGPPPAGSGSATPGGRRKPLSKRYVVTPI